MKLSIISLAIAAIALANPLSISRAGDHADPVSQPPDPSPSHMGHAHHHDSHAPIGVMGDHIHATGEFMLSYRYMYMLMDDNFLGSDKIADARIISPAGEGYLVTPTEMETQMHMIGGMYAPSDFLTLMVMLPYLDKRMDHLRRDGVEFTTSADGIGDFTLSTLWKLYHSEVTQAHFNLGLSFPTGDTDAEGFIPGPGVTRLPYPMQLGSGTYDLQPGLTWVGQRGDFSWGSQFMALLPLESENDEGYKLGDRFDLTLWTAYRMTDWVSASVRVKGSTWDNIDGFDRNLRVPAGAVPTADPRLRGGDRVDIFGGLNFYLPSGLGFLSGQRLGLEAGAPVYQDLDGPQLGMDWMVLAGFQLEF